MEAQKLAVGKCDFTCCQRNHIFDDRVVPCDRGITRSILETLIESKVKHLFKIQDLRGGRCVSTISTWWLRASSLLVQTKWQNLRDFKQNGLMWNDTASHFPLLLYTVLINRLDLVREVFSTLDKEETSRVLSWKFPRKGVVEFGVPGTCVCVCVRIVGLSFSLSFSPLHPTSINNLHDNKNK